MLFKAIGLYTLKQKNILIILLATTYENVPSGKDFIFTRNFTVYMLDSQGYNKFLHAANEDSDQTARMHRLSLVIVDRICKKVCFLSSRSFISVVPYNLH